MSNLSQTQNQEVAEERIRRWRLIIGDSSENTGEGSDGEGSAPQSSEQMPTLSADDAAMDAALDALYGDEGGFGDSAPEIVRWLDDIRKYFPASVAEMLQKEALNRVKFNTILSDPELLAHIKPDVDLVAKIISLSRVMPSKTRETAKAVVQQVVDDLREKLTYPLQQALQGRLSKTERTRRPRHMKEMNWQHTIRANLKHYQPAQKTVVLDQLIGYGKRRSSLHEVILCIDQSGSMAQSVVYASVFGAVMASLPSLKTHLITFSTSVVDLTEEMTNPVDLLFGVQLRGGTNINRALGYCQQLVTKPQDTTLVLITDLFEGGKPDNMLQRVQALLESGVQVIVLLALNDQGAPRFNRAIAHQLANMGVPCFACTPELFPEMMGAALNQQDIRLWAASHNIVTAPSN